MNGLYGDSIFNEGLIRDYKKKKREIQDVIAQIYYNDIFKLLKTIYDNVVAGLKKDKNFKKYIEYKIFSIARQKDIKISDDNTKVLVPIKIFALDVDKIFKDVYGMDTVDYNADYNTASNACDKPAPKFVKLVKEISKACEKYVKSIKIEENINIKLNFYIDLDNDWKELESGYSRYISDEELLGILEFVFDYNELKEKAEYRRNNPSA